MGKSKSSCHCNGAQLQHSHVSTTTEKIERTNLQTPERRISKKSWIRCGLFLTKTNTYKLLADLHAVNLIGSTKRNFSGGFLGGSLGGSQMDVQFQKFQRSLKFCCKGFQPVSKTDDRKTLASRLSYQDTSCDILEILPRKLQPLPSELASPKGSASSPESCRRAKSTKVTTEYLDKSMRNVSSEFLEAGGDWPIVLPNVLKYPHHGFEDVVTRGLF